MIVIILTSKCHISIVKLHNVTLSFAKFSKLTLHVSVITRTLTLFFCHITLSNATGACSFAHGTLNLFKLLQFIIVGCW